MPDQPRPQVCEQTKSFLAASQPRVAAPWMVEADGSDTTVTYEQMSERSQRAAGCLADELRS